MTTPAEFQALLEHPEGRRVEFKAASGGFHFEELIKYCVALANEGGGTIERVGRARHTVSALAEVRSIYVQGGAYRRRRGLDRETNKTPLIRHIEDSAAAGTRLEELKQVLPGLSRHQVQSLLRELKRDGRVEVKGTTKAARWFPAGQKRNPTQCGW